MNPLVSTIHAIAVLFLFIAAVSSLPQNLAGSSTVDNSLVQAPSSTPNATISSGLPPTKAFQTSASSPTVDIGLGGFHFLDVSVGTKLNRGAHVCNLEFGGADVLGCKSPYAVVGNTYCVDLNGRHSASICDGVATVEFPSEPVGPTYIHYTAPNGTYTGCTASTKNNGNCINNQLGQGSFGSPNYVGGWCVMDIIQYQKKDPNAQPSSTAAQYSYSISVYDSETSSTASDSKNGRNLIASTKSGETFYGPDKSAVTVNFDGTSSKLPSQMMITSGNVDSDPYTISYQSPYLTGDSQTAPGPQVFNAYDTNHQCSLANVFPDGGHGNTWGYDSGNRKNTCGFSC